MARTSNRRRHAYSNIKRKEGKRSGLEVQVASQLAAAGVDAEYEKHRIPYRQIRDKHYKPDFKLPNGIFIETKGWFKSADRSKHLAIKYQYPDLDIRFVFSNSKTKLGKKSTTTYGMWCAKNGFKYADKTIPQAWLEEKPPRKKPERIHYDKSPDPSCEHRDTFMYYPGGDSGADVCWQCGFAVKTWMAGHN